MIVKDVIKSSIQLSFEDVESILKDYCLAQLYKQGKIESDSPIKIQNLKISIVNNLEIVDEPFYELTVDKGN